jgi:hypothetical protein
VLSAIIQRKKQLKRAKFGVLAVVTLKFTVLWDVTPCSMIDHYQIFGENPEDGGITLLTICHAAGRQHFTVYRFECQDD